VERLKPGQQIREEELAEACGVSRTPIRDALRKLAQDGYIRKSETNRNFVAGWSDAEIEESFHLRAMLEGEAASRAAERINSEGIDELQDLNSCIAETISNKSGFNTDSFLGFNKQFHKVIINAADSNRLATLLSMLVEEPIVYKTIKKYSSSSLMSSVREHENLISALKNRDSLWAKSIMIGHVRRAYFDLTQAVADKVRSEPGEDE
jgi:DNA-binding GntR family transcriptional regulator